MRTCPGKLGTSCGKFRSALACDPHSLCSICRGTNCDRTNNCPECIDWSDEQWNLFESRGKYRAKKSSGESSNFSFSKPPVEERLDNLEVSIEARFNSLSTLLKSYFEKNPAQDPNLKSLPSSSSHPKPISEHEKDLLRDNSQDTRESCETGDEGESSEDPDEDSVEERCSGSSIEGVDLQDDINNPEEMFFLDPVIFLRTTI